MGMTIAEKILASRAGRDSVVPGELLFAKLDLIMGTDVTVPLSVSVFNAIGAARVFDPSKIALVNDHFVPAKDVSAAELSKTMRVFAERNEVRNYFEVGRSGLCHCIVPEAGLVKPGDLIIGADSHTCTYGALGAFATGVGSTDMACGWALGESWFRVPPTIKVVFTGRLPELVGGKDLILHAIGRLGVAGALYCALEFAGPVIDDLPLSDRFTICNMAIEAGAKTGIIAADAKAEEYVRRHTQASYTLHRADPDAAYQSVMAIDVTELEPQVARPYLPSNVVPVSETEHVPVHQVVIGSCTNGRWEDFTIAAEILKGKKIADRVRLIVIPSTAAMYGELMDAGIIRTLLDAGAVISPPTCGPCIGGHMGILASDEVGFYTTNRNFVGRNGHFTSKVFLGSPATAAATALTGEITDPRKVVG